MSPHGVRQSKEDSTTCYFRRGSSIRARKMCGFGQGVFPKLYLAIFEVCVVLMVSSKDQIFQEGGIDKGVFA